jgi:capsular polysaccharide biosynthesis protein
MELARQMTMTEFDGAVPPAGDPSSTVAGRLLSVPFLLRALRRRWKVWAITGVAGILIGAAISVAVPPQPSAMTTILLSHPSGTDPNRAMATDVALIMTSPVAANALGRLGPDTPTGDLSYGATALGANLMQITAHGPTARIAVKFADAVAAAFFDFRRSQFQQQSQTLDKALELRQRALDDELNAIAAQINTLQPPQPPGKATTSTTVGGQVADLLARRAIINDQLTRIRDQTGNNAVDAEAVQATSRVIEQASPVTPSKKRALAKNVIAGLVAGMAAGAAWVVLWAAVSDRVRRREDVMTVLQAPVALSIDRLPRSVRAARRRFLRHPAQADRRVSRVVHHLARVLPLTGAGQQRLLVVSLDSDTATALAVAHLAVELTNDQKRVLLADLSRGLVLARILGAPTGVNSMVEIRDTKTVVQLVCPPHGALDASDSPKPSALREHTDVVVSVATLDPSLGAWHLSEWATVVVLIVTAGRSSEEELRSASRMLRAASLDLHSVVLVAADRNDATVGIPDQSQLVLAAEATLRPAH